MESLALNKVSIDRNIRGGTFPLEFGRQARALPVRIRVGFEVTDVGDRLVFIDGAKTRKSKIPPGAIPLRPVKRRLPALLVYGCPAQREPKLRPRVTAVTHEFEIFAVRYRPRRERKRQHQSAVTRAFVVVGKSGAVVTDLHNGFVELNEVGCRDISRFDVDLTVAKDGVERILREDVFDVGHEQFLMLLFVMDAKYQNRLNFAEKSFVRAGNQIVDVR